MKISTINWAKVPVGSLVYVRNDIDQDWHLRKFAIYIKNNDLPFGCFGDLSTNGSVVWWKYAKLMEE